MEYPFKYPKVYGELAMQGKTKKDFVKALNITMAGLRYKQSIETDGDFRGDESGSCIPKQASRLFVC